MKFTEINKIFTEKVADYISKGYTINTSTMTGSQGEIGKVDLVKNKELIRIWISSERSYSWTDKDAFHGCMMVLRVSKWSREYPNHIYDTIWIKDLTHLEEYTFYKVDDYRDWYVDDLTEALRVQGVRHYRFQQKSLDNTPKYLEMTDAIKEIASNFMKRKQGYSRISKDDLRVRNSDKGYTVIYRGHSYKLS